MNDLIKNAERLLKGEKLADIIEVKTKVEELNEEELDEASSSGERVLKGIAELEKVFNDLEKREKKFSENAEKMTGMKIAGDPKRLKAAVALRSAWQDIVASYVKVSKKV